MSAIYQDQEFVITEQDLAQVEQELNQKDDYQTLTVLNEESWLDELEARWESDYSPRPLTEEEEREWLEYENERLDSDIEETQNEW